MNMLLFSGPMRPIIVTKRLSPRRRWSGLLRTGTALLVGLFCTALADLHAAEGQNVQLEVGGGTVRAFMVQEDVDVNRPGVVVVHEWWGLNEQMRGVAERVAEFGYAVIVPDLYHGRLPGDLGYAYDFMRDLDEEWVMQVLQGAIQHLRSMPGASRRPVGMLGFDMGGRLTLSAALQGLPVQAAISFYGDTRSNREELESLDVPFLGIFARDDRATPPDAVERFETLLEELEKNAEILVMPNVGRFFSNEDRPGYDAEAASGAWYHMKEFLAGNLNGAEYVPRQKIQAFPDEPLDKERRWKKKPPR